MGNEPPLLIRVRELLLDGRNEQAMMLLRRNGRSLDHEAVAVIADLDADTLSGYLESSTDGGRHVDDPIPAPAAYAGRSPLWAVEQAPDVLAWLDRRPSRGAASRRPWPERAPTPANAAAKPSRGRRSPE
jgi:hypothetical protein